jgi:hypothetical protein
MPNIYAQLLQMSLQGGEFSGFQMVLGGIDSASQALKRFAVIPCQSGSGRRFEIDLGYDIREPFDFSLSNVANSVGSVCIFDCLTDLIDQLGPSGGGTAHFGLGVSPLRLIKSEKLCTE